MKKKLTASNKKYFEAIFEVDFEAISCMFVFMGVKSVQDRNNYIKYLNYSPTN